MSAHDTQDGLYRLPPQAPYVDPDSGVWVLSRYVDVLAAFRDQRLWPVNSRGEESAEARDDHGSLLARGDVRDALSTARLDEWRTAIDALAHDYLQRLPTDRPVDLLHHFAKPWCLSLGIIVTAANPGDREQLSDLGDHVFGGNGAPPESPLKVRAAEAVVELERYFHGSSEPMAQPTFIGVSQTLPRLLVNGWLALFRHPDEVARLRADPDLVPRAVEELLRYAGIIPRLFRKATADVDLDAVRLEAGERVTLMIASANRDPAQFPQPDRLDVSRRATGQLALGIGRSSCAGARLIRMASGVAIGSILRTFEDLAVVDAIQWRSGSGFCWPSALRVELRRAASIS